MPRIAYVNGQYVTQAEAQVSIDDRGFQFADGVYEVWALRDGRILDWDGHTTRLYSSLSELRMAPPVAPQVLRLIVEEVIRRNRLRQGLVYLQVTRGVAPRDHAFPSPQPRAGLILTAKPIDMQAIDRKAEAGVRVITVPESRWARCDIKTTSLTANVMAKQQAREAGAFEAWFVDAGGFVTEGASTNAWIVDAKGVLRTRPSTDNILRGITRARVLAVAQSLQIPVSEQPFSPEEAYDAQEAFVTSATAFVMPVTYVDGHTVGAGVPGPVTKKLRTEYLRIAAGPATA